MHSMMNQQFLDRRDHLIDLCANEGVHMVPYSNFRGLDEQNRLWRQSRPSWKIREKIDFLRDRGAHYLADSLDRVGPSSGPHVTNAYGGLSWHNWGEASDCYWSVDGRAVWDINIGGRDNGYKVFARLAGEAGLTSLGYEYGWDWVHVQLRHESSPAKLYSVEEVNDRLIDFYEGPDSRQLPLHFGG